MAGVLTQPHTQRLEALRRVRHVLQGEEASIVLLKREPGANALSELLSVDRSWAYDDADSRGNKLPPEVMFELQIGEDLLTADDLKQAVAIKHGAQLFQIVRPSPFAPVGFQRYWRFWLAPAEEV
jgi:hypothetical protein